MPQSSLNQEELQCKQKAYSLLYQLITKRNLILANLDLPTYDVPWLKVPVVPQSPPTDSF